MEVKCIRVVVIQSITIKKKKTSINYYFLLWRDEKSIIKDKSSNDLF